MGVKTAIVVGSGPSGVTTATYLLRHGWKVTMLDFGNVANSMDRFRLPANLTNENREKLVQIEELSWRNRKRGLESLDPRRIRHHYFFADTDSHVVQETRGAVANISLAFGGLSNVWGGNVLAPDGGDIQDWPVSIDELKPYYASLAELMPISADGDDAISRRFDFPCGRQPAFPLGPQGQDLLLELGRYRTELERKGVYFGRAKLAIDPGADENEVSNRFPFGPIFNSAGAVAALTSNPDFTYRHGVFVEHVGDDARDGVTVAGGDAAAGSALRFTANKAFLACGVFGTSQLLARSLRLDDRPIRIRSNQNAFFPFIRFRRTRGISRLPTNSISQLFVDIQNESTQNRFAHIEVHQMGDYVLNPLKGMLGRVAPVVVAMGRPVLERLLVMQAFLHSDFSDMLEVRYRRSDNWKATITGVRNPVMRESYRALLAFLARNRGLLRGWPLRQILLIDPPGASNHLGGAFPMCKRPVDVLSSDPLGRPFGCDNIHVTDATVLPSLPATTLTFSIMANAARIADSIGKGQGLA